MHNIAFPKDLDSLRAVLSVAIETYQGSPVKNTNKLNESMAKALGFGNYDRLAAPLKEPGSSAFVHIPDVRIDDENRVFVDDNEIHEFVFDDERSDYIVRTRDELIDNLCDYIAEARTSRAEMLKDLVYLTSLNDEYVFSSIITNHFVAASDNPKLFCELAQTLIDLDAQYLKEQCGEG